MDGGFQGPSLDALSGVASSLFPSTSASDAEMTPLGSMAVPFVSYQHAGEQPKPCDYGQFSDPHPTDYTLVKQEHKAPGGSKHQPLGSNAAAFSRPQKVLTLEKYREKHAAELALLNGIKEEPDPDVCTAPPPLTSYHHKKRSQPQQGGHSGDGRRERSGSKKSRLPTYGENGTASGEEIKMRIKVSSDRHGGLEHGGALPGKDKHKEHGGHRHSKHGHAHVYALGGSGRGTVDNPTLAVRAHGNHLNDTSSSSRKRPHSDAGNHHHHLHYSSKRSAKGGLGSSHYSTDGSQRTVDHHGNDGPNGLLSSNGQHTNYKDTFDILDSLLSAQGMNL